MQDSDSFYIRQRVNSSGRYQVPDPLLSDAADIVRHLLDGFPTPYKKQSLTVPSGLLMSELRRGR